MCGIVGYIDVSYQSGSKELKLQILRMANEISHRGPDDTGVWVDEKEGIAFGHRRLSIRDLSPEGHQPMLSKSTRYVLIFNGEIYNFKELRAQLELQGSVFRGHSDTEVMLECIERWGIQKALERFVGMYAFVLWDSQERLLYLGRDRMGEKPLYYGWMGHTFFFGSELKALRAHMNFKPKLNRDVLPLYLRYNCIPDPYSIYKGIYKLLPATLLVMNPHDPSKKISSQTYWSAKEIVESGEKNPFEASDAVAILALDGVLRKAVSHQMVADVPLGAFLSGGIDSTTIVSLMQAQSQTSVKTFTIGFEEADYNEALHAKIVAQHLGTDHTELYVTSKQTRDIIPKLPFIYDEPFADSSQIPTFLVSQLARQHVTVSLSGDGGDELFGGYNRHYWVEKIWNRMNRFPNGIRKMGASSISAISPDTWNFVCNRVLNMKYPQIGDKLHKVSQLLLTNSPEDMYDRLASQWENPESVVLGATEWSSNHREIGSLNISNIAQKMMYLDMITYLPNDILVKVDRASMHTSLESRAPFLNHHVVEFACRLPLSMKIRDGQTKWLLRQVLHQYVPKEFMDRPKMGFSVPIDSWLRGPLREWAESLLNEERLQREGFFNPVFIRKKWEEHLSGKRNWQSQLWIILMFQAWIDEYA